MSGGALDYLYTKVEDGASIILSRAQTPIERAFGNHLLKISKALRAIEWVYSGDGDDTAWDQIRGIVGPTQELRQAINDAKLAQVELQAVLDRAEKKT